MTSKPCNNKTCSDSVLNNYPVLPHIPLLHMWQKVPGKGSHQAPASPYM